jgi:peptidoglycan biosynthesis protein MviN/MurJ (putative lipid II flippase)
MGLPGVALSFVISTYLQAAFYLIYTGKLLGVSPLSLIPLRNWLVKLIVYACLFIAVHYVGYIYFTGTFTLILGAVGMALSIAFSLLIEMYIQKKRAAHSHPAVTHEGALQHERTQYPV